MDKHNGNKGYDDYPMSYYMDDETEPDYDEELDVPDYEKVN